MYLLTNANPRGYEWTDNLYVHMRQTVDNNPDIILALHSESTKHYTKLAPCINENAQQIKTPASTRPLIPGSVYTIIYSG